MNREKTAPANAEDKTTPVGTKILKMGPVPGGRGGGGGGGVFLCWVCFGPAGRFRGVSQQIVFADPSTIERQGWPHGETRRPRQEYCKDFGVAVAAVVGGGKVFFFVVLFCA